MAAARLEWPAELCERADAIISAISPDRRSLQRREGVQRYVKAIITRCFYPEQVFFCRM